MKYYCDCETFPTYWMVGFMDDDYNVKMFHLNEKINQIAEFIQFMSQQDIYIGYNIILYDAQLFEYIFKNPNCTNADLFEESQRIIENSKGIPEWNLKHKYLDLYKIHHFDRFHVSLKWCEFGLDHDSLEDLPYKFNTRLTIPQMREVAMYNKNDLLATKKLYDYSTDAIDLRNKISDEYKITATNLSDSAIGRKIALKTYCDISGKESKEVVKERTVRDKILLKHCIDNRISFINPKLQEFLINLKKSSLDILNRDMKFEVKSQTYIYDMLKGGLHSKNSYNIIESSDTHKIIDLDFSSFYPGIMIQLSIYPEHLGKDFLIGLDKLTKQRLQAKKDGNKAVALSLKLSINSIFGSLGDEYSWLRDEFALYRVTVNGQLLLLMLIDKLEQIGAKFFYANTDGASLLLEKSLEASFYKICSDFYEVFNCELEFQEYKKCYIGDVNNYLIITSDGETKLKGRFDFKDNKLQKNKSELIVPKAVYEYFVNNIPIEDTIKNSTNIFDFCIGQRSKSDSWFEIRKVINGIYIVEQLPKTIRYYVSTDGDVFKKKYDSNKEEYLIAHPQKGRFYKQTLFNKYIQKSMLEYNIDYNYYIKQARKEIDSFFINQTTLI